MAPKDFEQPEIIDINDSLRLRKYDGHYELFLPGYQNPVVYQNSEGIFDESRVPDLNYVKGMCTYLAKVGELYYIEAKENGTYVPIGDVSVKDENPPIAIWVDAYRGKGIGKLVMQTVIDRLKELGFAKITWEDSGIKRQKHGDPKKEDIANEIRQAMVELVKIARYYHVEDELEASIQTSLECSKAEGLID